MDATDLTQYFLGYARVPLRNFSFRKEPDKKNVERLLRIFNSGEGCKRHFEKHFATGRVLETNFSSKLARSAYSVIPVCNVAVECLEGTHRLEAATQFYQFTPPENQWWPVRLFSKDLPAEARRESLQSFQNEQAYSDGNIFRMIRWWHREGRIEEEHRWWGRLSPTKQRDLNQLIKHERFIKIYDLCIDMPGLWDDPDLTLGTHRLQTLRCDEEIERYMKQVHEFWSGCDAILPGGLDAGTVRSLEMLCPGAESDMKLIREKIATGQAFPSAGTMPRETLTRYVERYDGFIPSFRTLFESLKLLEPCAEILKKLVGDMWPDGRSRKRVSIEQFFRTAFTSLDIITVESQEGLLETDTCNLPANDRFRIAYVQLWLFCLRHFPQMTSIMPRKEPRGKKPNIQRNDALWVILAELGCCLGFEKICKFSVAKKQIPEIALAKQFLRCAKPDVDPADEFVQLMAPIIKRYISQEYQICHSSGEETTDVDRRMGIPYDDDFVQAKHDIFLLSLFKESERNGVTKLYIFRDFIWKFFGLKSIERFEISGEDRAGQGPTGTAASGRTDPPTTNGPGSSDKYVLQRELEACRQHGKTLQNKLDASRTSLETANERIQQFQDELDACRKHGKTLQNEVETARKALKVASERIQQFQSELESCRMHGPKLQSEMEASASQPLSPSPDHLREIEAFQMRNQNLKGKLNTYRNHIDKLEQEMAYLRKRQSQPDGGNQELIDSLEIESLKRRNADLQKKLDKCHQDGRVLRSQLNDLRERLGMPREELPVQTEQKPESNSSSSKQAQDYPEVLAEVQRQYEAEKQKNRQNRQKYQDLEIERQELQQQIKDLKGALNRDDKRVDKGEDRQRERSPEQGKAKSAQKEYPETLSEIQKLYEAEKAGNKRLQYKLVDLEAKRQELQQKLDLQNPSYEDLVEAYNTLPELLLDLNQDTAEQKITAEIDPEFERKILDHMKSACEQEGYLEFGQKARKLFEHEGYLEFEQQMDRLLERVRKNPAIQSPTLEYATSIWRNHMRLRKGYTEHHKALCRDPILKFIDEFIDPGHEEMFKPLDQYTLEKSPGRLTLVRERCTEEEIARVASKISSYMKRDKGNYTLDPIRGPSESNPQTIANEDWLLHFRIPHYRGIKRTKREGNGNYRRLQKKRRSREEIDDE